MTITDRLGKTTGDVVFVSKGWGFEKILVNNDQYCGKLLHFVAGRKCSLHFHKKKHETFYLHKGRMEVFCFDDAPALQTLLAKGKDEDRIQDCMERFQLTQGMTFEIPVGRVHQMVAQEDCELFEFSMPDSDDDSYRIIKGD